VDYYGVSNEDLLLNTNQVEQIHQEVGKEIALKRIYD
jgi:hypothetical protein